MATVLRVQRFSTMSERSEITGDEDFLVRTDADGTQKAPVAALLTAAEEAAEDAVDATVAAAIAAHVALSNPHPVYGTAASAAAASAAAASASAAASVASTTAALAATARPGLPQPTDDSTRGYAVGDLWTAPGGRVFQALAVTEGAAVWSAYDAEPLAGDAVPSGLIAAYGMQRLRRAYAGPGIEAGRSSDSETLDVDFLADHAIDYSELDAFLGTAEPTIPTWYDQTGNGHHATYQASHLGVDLTVPQITPFPAFGSARGVHFDAAANYDNDGTPIRDALTLPDTLTASSRAVSIVVLGWLMHSTRIASFVQLTAPAATGNNLVLMRTEITAQHSLTMYCGNTSRGFLQTYSTPAQPAVFGCASGDGTSLCDIYAEDRFSRLSMSVAPSASLVGGLLGGSTTNTQFSGVILGAVLIYNRKISGDEYRKIARALYRDFNIRPQPRGVIAVHGDSIAEGGNARWYQGWVRQFEPLLNVPARIYSEGLGGSTWGPRSSEANIALWQADYNAAAPYNLALPAWGTNDIFSNLDLATIQANCQTWIANVLAANDWAFPLFTVLPRAGFTEGEEVIRGQYNTWIRENWEDLGAAFLVDLAADPVMGAAGAEDNTALYIDGTHPTRLGHTYIAHTVAKAVNAWVATQT